MDILSKIFSLSGMTVVLFGSFLIAALGYALGRITIKGVSLGTAGVFLMALLFGYLFTLPGLAELPILENFFIESADTANVQYYKMIEAVGLVLFVTAVGFIAGPSFFRNLKKNAKSYVLLGVIIIGLRRDPVRAVFSDSGDRLSVWYGHHVRRPDEHAGLFCCKIRRA